MTRFVCISDTHGIHNKIPPLPWGDILIHAGDFTGWGTLPEMEYFAAWMGQQDHEIKIAIAGNHDECAAEDEFTVRRLFGNHGVIYLKDSYTRVLKTSASDPLRHSNGARWQIYGTPYTPEFCGWHFMEYEHELRERYAKIPDDTDILICHGPPRGILDKSGFPPHERAGSSALMDRISQLDNLKLVVCGHIHNGRGILHENGVTYVNAASLGENYEPRQEEAIVIDL